MLKNLTRNSVVSRRITKVEDVNKLIGLIGKNKPEPLLIKTRFGIHTFFLRFKIDIVVLDSENRVIYLKIGVKPNSIIFWNPRYDTVLELPQESIINSKTEKGDILEIIL